MENAPVSKSMREIQETYKGFHLWANPHGYRVSNERGAHIRDIPDNAVVCSETLIQCARIAADNLAAYR